MRGRKFFCLWSLNSSGSICWAAIILINVVLNIAVQIFLWNYPLAFLLLSWVLYYRMRVGSKEVITKRIWLLFWGSILWLRWGSVIIRGARYAAKVKVKVVWWLSLYLREVTLEVEVKCVILVWIRRKYVWIVGYLTFSVTLLHRLISQISL